MAGRIRSIKPEILDDETALDLSDSAWRLWVSSWLLADDHGLFRASPRYLAAEVWKDTRRTDDAARAMDELARKRFVRRYEVEGQRYAQIKPSGWKRHQRIDHPGKPRVPTPAEGHYIDPETRRSPAGRPPSGYDPPTGPGATNGDGRILEDESNHFEDLQSFSQEHSADIPRDSEASADVGEVGAAKAAPETRRPGAIPERESSNINNLRAESREPSGTLGPRVRAQDLGRRSEVVVPAPALCHGDSSSAPTERGRAVKPAAPLRVERPPRVTSEAGAAKAAHAPAQPRKPAPPKLESKSQETALQVAWRTWREAYARTYRRAYPNESADGKAMKRAIQTAEDMIQELGRPASDLEILLVHRWRKYLADPGRAKHAGAPGFLQEAKHPLRCFEPGIASYGTPWDTKEPKASGVRELRLEELPARRPVKVVATPRDAAPPPLGLVAFAAVASTAIPMPRSTPRPAVSPEEQAEIAAARAEFEALAASAHAPAEGVA